MINSLTIVAMLIAYAFGIISCLIFKTTLPTIAKVLLTAGFISLPAIATTLLLAISVPMGGTL